MLLLSYFSPFSSVEDPHVMDAIPIQTVSSYLSKHHLEIQHRNAQRFVHMVILNRVSLEIKISHQRNKYVKEKE